MTYDIDFTGYTITIMNVLYDDCSIDITGFDENQNRIVIDIPNWIKQALFSAKIQGLDDCSELIRKLTYESKMIKDKQKIPYDNTIA